MRDNSCDVTTKVLCTLALAVATGVVGSSCARQVPPIATATVSAGADTASGGRVVLRRVWTVGQYVGLSGSSVSPDGRYLTFTDWTTGDLAVHDLITGENRRVTNKGPFSKVPEYAGFYMQFSGDGKQIAYNWHRKAPYSFELRVINLDGSGSRLIYRNEEANVLAYDWSVDGKYVAAVLPKTGATAADRTALQIALIGVTDGSVQTLREFAGSQRVRMSFSPDGRFLAHDLPATGAPEKRDVFVLRIDDGQETGVVTHPANDRLLGWTPDGGALLFTSDRAGTTGAWLQPLQDGKPQGSARLVKDNLGEAIRPLGFTRDGAYYYATSDAVRREVYTAFLDLDKGIVTDLPARAPQVPGSNEGPEWSQDGKFLAYIHGGNSIVIRSLETGEERSLTTKTIQNFWTVGWGERYLRWSPDGRQLLAPQGPTLFLINVTTGEATPLESGGWRTRYGRWSRDGKAVFYVQLGQETRVAEIVKQDLETRQEEVLYSPDSAPGDDYFASLELSPDGRWLAFSGSDKTSGTETVLMVISAEGGQPRLLLRVPESEQVKVVGWSPDGREILFTRDLKLATERSTTLWRIRIEGGAPRKLELGKNVLNDIRFHPDGRRVAFDSGQRGAEIWVMQNFLPPLKSSK